MLPSNGGMPGQTSSTGNFYPADELLPAKPAQKMPGSENPLFQTHQKQSPAASPLRAGEGRDAAGFAQASFDLAMRNAEKLIRRGADLRWANLAATDLSRSDLRQADLRSAVLSGAVTQRFPFRLDLRGANLSGADLRQVVSDRPLSFSGPFDGRGAVYNERSRFPEGYEPQREGLIRLEPGIDAAGQMLAGVSLNQANLTGIDFSGGNLRRVDLRLAVLRDANLSGVQLQGADLDGMVWNGDTRFSGATYSPSTRFPANFDPQSQGMILEDPLGRHADMLAGLGLFLPEDYLPLPPDLQA